jgi:hypothetical protein
MLAPSRCWRASDMCYCLQLPEGTRLHDVFHMGLLNSFHEDPRRLHCLCRPNRTVEWSTTARARACVALSTTPGHLACTHSMVWLSQRWPTCEPFQQFKDLYVTSSSRTSCSKRQKEMLWSTSPINAGDAPVARPHKRLEAKCSWFFFLRYFVSFPLK